MLKSKYRFIYMILVGIGISFLLGFFVNDKNVVKTGKIIFFHFFTSVVITVIVWEGNLYIDKWMNRKFPWLLKPMKRILAQLPLSIIFSASAIYFIMLLFDLYLCQIPENSREALVKVSLLIGLMITVILLAVESGGEFFSNWKKSLVEVEKYKTESLHAQLQNLKNQINPHFLFNNLSVLSSLVYKDQDKSVDFINQLSKVYRYLLDNANTELVTLESEMNFIKSYTYLLQIRFDTNIVFSFHIPDNKLQQLIPPMALQMLIENTIKHNEVSSEFPLHVSITVAGNLLEVNNNLQPRTVTDYSSKTGLQNIQQRYSYFTKEKVQIIKTEKQFIVKLPLLNSK